MKRKEKQANEFSRRAAASADAFWSYMCSTWYFAAAAIVLDVAIIAWLSIKITGSL